MSEMSAPDNSEYSSLSVGGEDGPLNDRDEDNMRDDSIAYSNDGTNSGQEEASSMKKGDDQKLLESKMGSAEEDNSMITAREEDFKIEEDSSKSNEDSVDTDVRMKKIDNAELNNSLLQASEDGNIAEVTRLLAEGANVECKDEYRETCAHKAAMRGHDAVLTALIDHGLKADTRGLWDRTPIMYAASNGHTSTVKLLHTRGAELDLQNEDGWTALILAAMYGRLETAAQLVVLGADIALQDKYCSNRAEQIAKQRGHHDTASLLNTWPQYKDIDKVMFHYAEDGNEKLVRVLITLGGNIHYTDKDCDTGYHKAVNNGHLNTVRTYLQHGMQVDCRGWNNRTALMYAAMYGHLGVVCELLEWGADTQLQYGY